MTNSSPVTLADAKAHLRIEHAAEDALITGYLLAAAQWFEKETGQSLEDVPTDDMGQIPQLIKQAILLIVGHWFENREAAGPLTIKTIPLAVESIVAQFAKPEAV